MKTFRYISLISKSKNNESNIYIRQKWSIQWIILKLTPLLVSIDVHFHIKLLPKLHWQMHLEFSVSKDVLVMVIRVPQAVQRLIKSSGDEVITIQWTIYSILLDKLFYNSLMYNLHDTHKKSLKHKTNRLQFKNLY